MLPSVKLPSPFMTRSRAELLMLADPLSEELSENPKLLNN
jgi:hypothetical protein